MELDGLAASGGNLFSNQEEQAPGAPIDQSFPDQNQLVSEIYNQADQMAGYAQSVANKAVEKARRLEETRVRKERELTGVEPSVPVEDDSPITRTLKEAWNAVAPHSMEVTTNIYGGKYLDTNKEFNDQPLETVAKTIQEEPDDPYADRVLYYLRVSDGYNDDGTPKWTYKLGSADKSAFERYKEQLPEGSYDILMEKRTNNADRLERLWQGNKNVLEARTYGYGDELGTKAFGSGYTELVNDNLLGVAPSEEQIAQTETESKERYYDYLKNYVPKKDWNMLRGVGSGTLNFLGELVSLVGPEELGQRIIEKSDEWTGYSPEDEKKAAKMAGSAWRDFQDGRYLSAIANLADAAITGGPEVFLKSLPDFLGTMALAELSGGASLAAKAGKIAKGLEGFAKLAPGIAERAAMTTKQDAISYKENNNGKGPDFGQYTSMYLGNVIGTALDFGAMEFAITKVGKGLGLALKEKRTGKIVPVEDILKKMKPSSASAFLGGLAKGIGSTAATGAVEGGTEVIQQAIQELNQRYGTEKYAGMSREEILQLPEVQASLAEAGKLGLIGGLAPGGVGGAGTIARGAVEAGKIRSSLNRAKQQASQLDTGDLEMAKQSKEAIGQSAKDIEADYRRTSEKLDKAKTTQDVQDIIDSDARATIRGETRGNAVIALAKELIDMGKAKTVEEMSDREVLESSVDAIDSDVVVDNIFYKVANTLGLTDEQVDEIENRTGTYEDTFLEMVSKLSDEQVQQIMSEKGEGAKGEETTYGSEIKRLIPKGYVKVGDLNSKEISHLKSRLVDQANADIGGYVKSNMQTLSKEKKILGEATGEKTSTVKPVEELNTLGKKNPRKLYDELSKYTTDQVQKILDAPKQVRGKPEPTGSINKFVEKVAKRVLSDRSNAEKEISSGPAANSISDMLVQRFPSLNKTTQKTALLSMLKSRKINYTDDVAKIEGMISQAIKSGAITETQGANLRKRLEKISKDAVERPKEEAKKETSQKPGEPAETETESPTTDEEIKEEAEAATSNEKDQAEAERQMTAESLHDTLNDLSSVMVDGVVPEEYLEQRPGLKKFLIESGMIKCD
jgi:hypothetical protein